MSYLDYKNYFKSLSDTHTDTAPAVGKSAFFSLNLDGLDQSLRGNVSDKKIVVLEEYEGELEDQDQDCIFDNQLGALMILEKVKKDDLDAEDQAYNDCKAIAFDFVSRMRRDSRRFLNEGSTAEFLRVFKPHRVEYHKVSRLFGQYAGCRIVFHFSEQVDLSYQPSKWTDS